MQATQLPQEVTSSNAARAVVLAAIAALALAGCGGGSGSTTPSSSASTSAATTTKTTTSARARRPRGHQLPVTIHMESPAVSSTGALAASYTCEGKEELPPLRWSNIPPHTAELALFLITGGASGGVLEITSVDWGVVGLKPTLHELNPNKLPAGALLGRNDYGSHHYSICPSAGANEDYDILMYALPHKLHATPGFGARIENGRATSAASAGGELPLTYQRPRFKISTPFEAKQIPTRYTCEGANVSPLVTWQNAPAHAAEIVLLMLPNQPPKHGRYVVDWAVGNVNPALGEVKSGSLPPGAVVGRNSFGHDGYSLCPAKGAKTHQYLLFAIALRRHLGFKPGFDASTAVPRINENVLGTSIAGGEYTRG